MIDQSEDADLIASVTALVREADQTFEKVGGSSRHWVRDCFLPLLNKAGFVVALAEQGEPMQPVERDEEGIVRFRPNAIVVHLLNCTRHRNFCDMNALAEMSFSIADREQFAQLIGYSLSGFGELSYVRDETYDRAEKQVPAPPSVERGAKE